MPSLRIHDPIASPLPEGQYQPTAAAVEEVVEGDQVQDGEGHGCRQADEGQQNHRRGDDLQPPDADLRISVGHFCIAHFLLLEI